MMKRISCTLAFIFVALPAPGKQVAAEQVLFASGQHQSQEAKTQSPEISELNRLNDEVLRLFGEGKFDEALPVARRALKISEKELGNDHRITADVRANLAELYIGKRDYDEAESNYKRTLAIYEKAFGADHLFVGKTLDRLAFLRFVKNDFEKAAQLFERTLAIKEKTLGAEHEEVVQALLNLTEVYGKTRERRRATPLYQRIIAIREKAFGDNHPKVAEVLEKFACSLYLNGEQSEAEKQEARANSILYKEAARNGEPIAPPLDIFTCKIVSNPFPNFPEAAKDRRWSGSTSLRIAVIVDETGKVTSAQYLSGDKLFKETAEKGALKARFRPTTVDGQPVKVKGEINYDFLGVRRTMTVMVPGVVRQ
jgi:TonB family protein